MKQKDQQIQDAQRVWDIYNNIQLDQLEFAHIGGELFFIDKLLNSSEMMILLREMEKPTIKYEGLNEYSLNHLYQLVTFVIKGAHPHDFLKKSKNVQQYFNNLCGNACLMKLDYKNLTPETLIVGEMIV